MTDAGIPLTTGGQTALHRQRGCTDVYPSVSSMAGNFLKVYSWENHQTMFDQMVIISGWWLTFFIFHNRIILPISLTFIFFRGVETANCIFPI